MLDKNFFRNKFETMKRKTLIFSLLVLAIFASCAKQKDSVTAVIRVTYGNPPQIENAGGNSLDTQKMIFNSYDFSLDADKKLNLSKLWNVSDDQAVAKLLNTITVEAGSEPGLFVVKVTGLEHGLAVKILDELCNYYNEKQISQPDRSGQLQKFSLTIVKDAE